MRGSIPRGKGRSPKSVTPSKTLSYQDLINQLDEVEKSLKSIEGMPKNSYFTHPYFGDLNFARAIYFLRLHTAHHLKIMDEIEFSCIYSKDPVETQVHA